MNNNLVNIIAYALLFSICTVRMSMALGNISMGIALLGFAYWCYLHKETLWTRLTDRVSKRFLVVYGIFLVSFLPSVLFPEPYAPYWSSLKQFPEMLIYRALPFFMLVLIIEKKETAERLLLIFLGVEAVDSLLSVWQVYGSASLQPVKVPHLGSRGIGFGGQVLNLAALLASLIPVTALLILDKNINPQLKLVAYGALPCMLLGAMIGLKSRALWLILLVMLPLVSYRYARASRKILCVVLALLVGTGVFFAANKKFMRRIKSSFNVTTNVSNTDRLWLWRSSIHMMKDHPVTGVGLGNFRFAYRDKYELPQIKQKKLSHAHNNWMHLGADAGIPGLLGYTFLTLWILATTFLAWLKKKNVYDLMLFCTWVGFTAYGLIDLTADASISVKLVCFLSGLILCLKKLSESVQQ